MLAKRSEFETQLDVARGQLAAAEAAAVNIAAEEDEVINSPERYAAWRKARECEPQN